MDRSATGTVEAVATGSVIWWRIGLPEVAQVLGLVQASLARGGGRQLPA